MKHLRTALCDLLGCRYPIVQTAMGWVSGPELVAASGNAGGFGFLAGATIPPQDIENEILQVRQLTDAPFGVNFHMYQPNAQQVVDLVIKHGVRAVSYSRSPGADMIRQLRDNGVVCMPTVGLPKHAIKAIELGATALTVQGGEGGGHTGSVPTSLLIPQVIDAVAGQVPIAAAGGFRDGRGLVAALAWGADGIAMGTRFLMTRESAPPEVTKQRYVQCTDPAKIIVSKAVDGLPQRMINNETLKRLERAGPLRKLCIAVASAFRYRHTSGASMLQMLRSGWAMSKSGDMSLAQSIMSANAPMIIQRSMIEGQPEVGLLPSGQVAGVINELRSCADVIQDIVSEAGERLRFLSGIEHDGDRS